MGVVMMELLRRVAKRRRGNEENSCRRGKSHVELVYSHRWLFEHQLVNQTLVQRCDIIMFAHL
jgi:hypothetical protein